MKKKAFSPQNIILTLSQAARLKKRQALTYFGQKIIKILIVRYKLSKGMRGEIKYKIHNTTTMSLTKTEGIWTMASLASTVSWSWVMEENSSTASACSLSALAFSHFFCEL